VARKRRAASEDHGLVWAASLSAAHAAKTPEVAISFASGVPDPRIAAPDILEKMAVEALKAGQEVYEGYGDVQGLPALREVIAKRFNGRARGARVSADEVMITSGSQQAVAAIALLAHAEKLRVLVETPGYLGVANAFRGVGNTVESVRRDKDGPLPESLARPGDGRPAVFYLCAEINNPMGTDLSPSRRRAVVKWAKEEGGILVSDEIFRDLRFEGTAQRGLVFDAGTRRAVAVSSISKSFMCGLRIGWLITSRERIRALLALKKAMDISCPPLMQGIALALFTSGAYDAHLARARRHYRVRRNAALAALKRHMPRGVTWTRPKGGFHMWVELPEGCSSVALNELTAKRGAAICPGPNVDVDRAFANCFRLNYGSLDPVDIRRGIEILAGAAKKLLKT